MKCYKGFKKQADGSLKCHGFSYREGQTYEMPEENIKLCKMGFHACHELYQCWPFYPHRDASVVYHEVECEGEIIESDDGDGKVCCSKITIGKEVDSSTLPFFNDCWNFHEGYARVQRKNGMYSFIDTDGNLIGDGNQWYKWAGYFHEGYARVQRKNGKYSFIEKNCNPIGDGNQWYQWIGDFSDGYAKVRREDGKYSFIDKSGNLIGNGNQWYKHADVFFECYAKVQREDGKWSFIDTDGKLIGNGNHWYKEVCGFLEGYAGVQREVGNWSPKYDKDETVVAICNVDDTLLVDIVKDYRNHALSFPTLTMCGRFFKCFGDLIELAKPLL